MIEAKHLRNILAATDGFVASAPAITLAHGQVIVTVGELREMAEVTLAVAESRAVAEHGSVAA